jgi:hypothetical protein
MPVGMVSYMLTAETENWRLQTLERDLSDVGLLRSPQSIQASRWGDRRRLRGRRMPAGDLCDRQSHLQPAAHRGHSKSFSDLIRAAQFE